MPLRPLAIPALTILITAASVAGSATAAHANPHKCFVITDGQGNDIHTTCVPWLLGAGRAEPAKTSMR